MKATHTLELLHPPSLHRLMGPLQKMMAGRLWLKVILGMLLGIGVGLLLGPDLGYFETTLASTIGEWLALPGLIFLRVVQMIVLPLIFASIILGVTSAQNISQLKRTGITIGVYFILTTTVAITIGIGLAMIIHPGDYIKADQLAANLPTVEPVMLGGDSIPQTITNLLPLNPLTSAISGEMLQIVIFAIIFALALVTMESSLAKPILDVLGAVQAACMKIVGWAMVLAPFAVFGLFARLVSQFGISTLLGVGVYVITVLLGLAIMLVIYGLIVFIFGRMNPLTFFSRIREVQLLAFSTSSSAAVMPLTMKTATEKLGVRPSISNFIVPLGATINMDGTALYQAVATVFLAQVFGVSLSITALALLVVTIVGASIGTPSAPGVGIAILATILVTVGIPAGGIALIIGVDRLLDMCRTAVNVSGDLTASTIIDRLIGRVNSESAQ